MQAFIPSVSWQEFARSIPQKYRPFKLKEFNIYQHFATSKVGTDAILLGAWAKHSSPKYILDIGTGTGIIALMLAQRYPDSQVHAIEINKKSCLEAHYNFQNSPFHTRLKLYNTSLQLFSQKTNTSYDLIVSNPPYFRTKNSTPSSNLSRAVARHNISLHPYELYNYSAKILHDKGNLSIISPLDWAVQFEKMFGLFNHETLFIHPKPGAYPNRILQILLSHSRLHSFDRMTLELSRHNYSNAYKALTSDFHPHF